MSVYEDLKARKATLAVVGLGYVGMPMALSFARKLNVIGFDTDIAKIEAYKSGNDITREVGDEALRNTTAVFTSDETELKKASFIVVSVPTPITDDHLPDLAYVESASRMIGRNLSEGGYVVFESTVYSGVTEDVCLPILEAESGLKCGEGFRLGYSPERINPGDKVHNVENIIKVVSGTDPETAHEIGKVYALIVTAGIFKAKSIKVAEIAKLEENAQRDINIAFMNEMSMIHDRLGIDTADVLACMKTKWNALGFSPGLVGGHCISVDPYYLMYKAEREDYSTSVVAAGRKINDNMAVFVAESVIKQMIQANLLIKQAKVYILGITFKENCPDIRNSLVVKIIRRLRQYGVDPIVCDPEAHSAEVKARYGIDLVSVGEIKDADAVVVSVAHDCFRDLDDETFDGFFTPASGDRQKVVADIKSVYQRENIEKRGYMYWCL